MRTVSQVIADWERVDLNDISMELGLEVLFHLKRHERLMQEITEGAKDPVAFDDMREVLDYSRDLLRLLEKP